MNQKHYFCQLVIMFAFMNGRFLVQSFLQTRVSLRRTSINDIERKGNVISTFTRRINTEIDASLELEIATIEDMEDVGAVLSVGTTGGDVLVLNGDLGAGKTCFSRGFVRARTGQSAVRVTSPTYLLSNTYTTNDVLIHHMDLYRLSEGKPEDLEPLNLDFVFKECISLVEWPSRLGELMPDERLEITFKIDPSTIEHEENTRYLTLTPHGDMWSERLARIENEGYLDDLIVEFEEE